MLALRNNVISKNFLYFILIFETKKIYILETRTNAREKHYREQDYISFGFKLNEHIFSIRPAKKKTGLKKHSREQKTRTISLSEG